ncbi:polysulfide reductase [Egibacter rhizosphaerae]|uniref:Polysulfide reductase n=1 Tax=Egibacter rhizosphaerae TaxID=1670831 RepID=A0A411YB16_9ACTN|nr:NrfD/PsrC family molybdoenzyme membrane anchor subunit [Egibacter rhizosphaerae]QBI18386.1 polysulfide reductase [Egibacter rhizosphaerae]
MSEPTSALPTSHVSGRATARFSDDLPSEWPEEVATYHGRPVVKEPEWTWEVPWYLFFGGIAGSASVIAAARAVTGDERAARRARRLAAAAAALCPPLLIADLGRPKRFLHMLRVLKPSSAMSVGSWTLAAFTGASSAALAAGEADALRRVRPLTDAGAAALGLAMSTYTGVLVADSAIPVWHHARRELPALFAAGATGGAAGLLQVAHPAPETRRLVLGAAAVELAVERRMTRHLGVLGEVYEQGDTGAWSKAAKACTAVGAALSVLPSRWSQRAGGALIAAGGLCQRWAVYRAGFASAADPRHVVVPQRQRLSGGRSRARTDASSATSNGETP